jgi:hypothetical protein
LIFCSYCLFLTRWSVKCSSSRISRCSSMYEIAYHFCNWYYWFCLLSAWWNVVSNDERLLWYHNRRRGYKSIQPSLRKQSSSPKEGGIKKSFIRKVVINFILGATRKPSWMNQ